jgi:hypothetical protein
LTDSNRSYSSFEISSFGLPFKEDTLVSFACL